LPRPDHQGLNDKLIENPDDAAALYRRGQVYATGRLQLATRISTIPAAESEDGEPTISLLARTVIGDLQAALKDCNEALRLHRTLSMRWTAGPRQPEERPTKNAIADFDAALKINRVTSH